jgi:hypothetical protein
MSIGHVATDRAPDAASVSVAPGEVLTTREANNVVMAVMGHVAPDQLPNLLLSVVVSWCVAQDDPEAALVQLVSACIEGVGLVLHLPAGHA